MTSLSTEGNALPTDATALKPLIGLTLEGLSRVASEVGLKPFAAGQMARRLYVNRVRSIDEMTELPLRARHELAKSRCVGREEPLAEAVSKDGTAKYLFRGVGGRDIESVFIPDRDRATLCVSSQAGCRMNCDFCMTGRGGFQGNLTAAQIINQILSVPGSEKLTNIVFMGMGEPLDNLQPVLDVIEILTAKWGMAWSPKRITVSTVGRTDRLRELLDKTSVHIAVSLHNPFGAQRAQIMPVERAYPLTGVIDLLRQYDFSGQRRLSFEYICWDGVNDSTRYAEALARMLRGLECRVNLIRFHAIPGSTLRPSTKTRMEQFRDLLNRHGITATIRASRGEDIMAACGMLAGAKDAERLSLENLNSDKKES